MSIQLKVADYCRECDNFQASVEHREMTACHPLYGMRTVTSHIVTCEHSEECDHIYRYIKLVEGGCKQHDNFLD